MTPFQEIVREKVPLLVMKSRNICIIKKIILQVDIWMWIQWILLKSSFHLPRDVLCFSC